MTEHDGRRSRRLESQHARQPVAFPHAVILAVAFPVRGDIAGIAHRHALKVRGNAAEIIQNFKGAGFLPFDPVGIDGIHQGDGERVADMADQRQGVVEVPQYLDDLRAMHHGLGQFPEGDLPLGNQHGALDAGAGGIGRGGG